MSASNTKDCVRDQIGKRIVGVLFEALPVGNRGLQQGNKTLVFDDGTGFTFANNGSFWAETAEDVRRAITIKERDLRAAQDDIEGVLALAGAVSTTTDSR